MISKDELLYKLETVIEYLRNTDGYEYKIYNIYVQIMDNQIQIL